MNWSLSGDSCISMYVLYKYAVYMYVNILTICIYSTDGHWTGSVSKAKKGNKECVKCKKLTSLSLFLVVYIYLICIGKHHSIKPV